MINEDLFGNAIETNITNYEDGLSVYREALTLSQQQSLVKVIKTRIKDFQTQSLPSGTLMHIKTQSWGKWQWVSDAKGMRYEPLENVPIPDDFLRIAAKYAPEMTPESVVVNLYKPNGGLGFHCDRQEPNQDAPILTVSLGLPARFTWANSYTTAPSKSITLQSGDIVKMAGQARRAYHKVEVSGKSEKSALLTKLGLEKPVRLSITIRQVC